MYSLSKALKDLPFNLLWTLGTTNLFFSVQFIPFVSISESPIHFMLLFCLSLTAHGTIYLSAEAKVDPSPHTSFG
jgi:hypothetical protein